MESITPSLGRHPNPKRPLKLQAVAQGPQGRPGRNTKQHHSKHPNAARRTLEHLVGDKHRSSNARKTISSSNNEAVWRAVTMDNQQLK